jgi:hypothetical protein
MSISTTITVGAVAVIALIASGVLRPSPVSGGQPSDPPASPSAPATPAPTPDPVDDFSDGSKTVELDIATPHDVAVKVDDTTGTIVDATTGRAGDGMSVRWYDLKVENVDDRTLRLTWVGFGADDEVLLRVAEVDGLIDLLLVQPGPYPNSDGLGFDRVLDLEFASPVNAADTLYSIQSGLDTDD